MNATVEAEPRRVEAGDRRRQLDPFGVQILRSELRQSVQLTRERPVEPAVAVSKARGRIPHLQIEIRCALAVVEVAALSALEKLGRFQVVNGVAPRGMLPLQLEELFGGSAHIRGGASSRSRCSRRSAIVARLS